MRASPPCCMDRPVGVGSWAVSDDSPFPDAWTPAVPFKAKAACRHHIPKQRHRVTNWAEYDAGLRARGSLTVWFTPEAIAAWVAAPRTSRGGQASSDLAIATTLTLRAVFRLALRQTEGLIGSILQLLDLDLAVPDHSTLSRRAETLAVPRPKSGSEPPCCMDRGCGRTEPDPCCGLCDADVLRASEVQHTVQHVGGDRHLGRLSPVPLEAQPVTDDALPARDIRLHQGAPVIP